MLLALGELKFGILIIAVWLRNSTHREQKKKKEQYRQCDDKNFSRFRASVWQDSRSKMKTSNTTTHNCDTGLLGSEYRVVNSPLTLLVF